MAAMLVVASKVRPLGIFRSSRSFHLRSTLLSSRACGCASSAASPSSSDLPPDVPSSSSSSSSSSSPTRSSKSPRLRSSPKEAATPNFKQDRPTSTPSKPPPKMLNDSKKQALQDKGYEIIGSHSAVKMCRWTKNSLKGRGQCYKHTFYGIASHQCMEATPSLACANKCTFCWRSHTNPVAMRWVFDEDDPKEIVEGAISSHQRKFVRQVVLGTGATRSERADEAQTVRHCALSLVGEPVLYPGINKFLGELHSRKISTFLVTNGQFPEQLEALPRITQLYVSIDAPDAAELIRVGRPLFFDAWERLLKSLDILRAHSEKGYRTVCRLTLQRGSLTREAAAGYAKLIRRARPDFVEAKGVTPVPQFKKEGVSIAALIPTHSEVRDFAEMLQEELAKPSSDSNGNSSSTNSSKSTSSNANSTLANDGATSSSNSDDEFSYGLASEHRHSCAVLLARTPFWQQDDGQFQTWIDFEAFFKTLQEPESGEEAGKLRYATTTPEWAEWNAPEAGFDPVDTPHLRAKARPDDYLDMAMRPLRRPSAKTATSTSTSSSS